MLSQLQRQSVASCRAPVPARQAPVITYQGCRRGLSLITKGSQTSVNDFKTGMTVEIDGTPYRVLEFLHVKPGKGAAFVRTKLKNLLNNSNQEKTFRGGETVSLADVSRREGQFTYADGDQVLNSVCRISPLAGKCSHMLQSTIPTSVGRGSKHHRGSGSWTVPLVISCILVATRCTVMGGH
eukprot:GHRR01024723.1.p1 GENE.GHRR01024723.1~~GHRR01024723.1.p1  ORF type:complete len:182 (+),score=18.72 GHRR01024723.1:109-654(+)